MKKITLFALLAFAASVLYAQVDVLGRDEGPRLVFSGELLGMYTLGLADEAQRVVVPLAHEPTPEGVWDVGGGRNGFMTRMDFSMTLSPVSWADLYLQFRARSRPGNPYIPLTLAAAGGDDFSLSFEQAWGRISLTRGLGSDLPFDVAVKAGLFDSAPASFQVVTRFGTENVYSRIRSGNAPSVQIEGTVPVPFAESLFLRAATRQRLNESIGTIYDTDGSLGQHGTGPVVDQPFALPLFASAQLRGIGTPIGMAFAELVYALNGDGIFSGHSFGAGGRLDIAVPGIDMVLPIGVGAALLEKNIDPMAHASHDIGNGNALFAVPGSWPDFNTNFSTVSFRRSLRVGVGAGLRWNVSALGVQANAGYSYSQVAHIYRDTLTLHSASFDLRVVYDDRFFVGGGVFLGTLADAEWRTGDDPGNRESGFSQVFRLTENMGFEAHAGVYLGGRSRLVLGYNLNRGLSMNHGIEAMSEAQIIVMQSGAGIADGLFQTGGFFTKLVISW
ncbi:MAG: hypothetical protein FWB79_02195 [Treponema sp.]|nr:hypothetical protein [Treponema sp.]